MLEDIKIIDQCKIWTLNILFEKQRRYPLSHESLHEPAFNLRDYTIQYNTNL